MTHVWWMFFLVSCCQKQIVGWFYGKQHSCGNIPTFTMSIVVGPKPIFSTKPWTSRENGVAITTMHFFPCHMRYNSRRRSLKHFNRSFDHEGHCDLTGCVVTLEPYHGWILYGQPIFWSESSDLDGEVKTYNKTARRGRISWNWKKFEWNHERKSNGPRKFRTLEVGEILWNIMIHPQQKVAQLKLFKKCFLVAG